MNIILFIILYILVAVLLLVHINPEKMEGLDIICIMIWPGLIIPTILFLLLYFMIILAEATEKR